MKRIHILLLIVLVAAIGVVLSLSMNSSTYAGFTEAAKHKNREFHVMGKLSPGKEIIYDAQKDANSFMFTMVDDKGTEMLVKYNDSKPQDFEKLEQVVVIGKMKEGHFEAHKMNLKCPSKYNKDQVPQEFQDWKFTDGE
jgi:cytochrome c-type biogenesis protein CcmE